MRILATVAKYIMIMMSYHAAESYKKYKYQEASAYENAVTYPFVMTRFGGLSNDAKNSCA